MARVSNTLIGKASGSIGNATFSTWKGINVLKEKAISVANPDTDSQKMNRSAMSQAVAIGRQIIAVIALGFKSLAYRQSAFNAFVSSARRSSFDYSAPPTASLVSSALLISKGSMSPTNISATRTVLGDGHISLEFSSAITGPGQSASDTVLAAAYNETLQTWSAVSTGYTRASESVLLPFPANSVSGNNLVLYLGFFNEITGSASDSVNDTSTVSN